MGRVMLGFLAAEGGAAAWFRAALGRVLLGFLAAEGGAAVRFGAALGRVVLGFLTATGSATVWFGAARFDGLGQLCGEFCLDFWPQKVA